jgi:hypothetical protein
MSGAVSTLVTVDASAVGALLRAPDLLEGAVDRQLLRIVLAGAALLASDDAAVSNQAAVGGQAKDGGHPGVRALLFDMRTNDLGRAAAGPPIGEPSKSLRSVYVPA